MANQLRIDPTRTTLLRRQFIADMVRRFKKISKALTELIVDDDAFGLNTKINLVAFQQVEIQAWRFQTNTQKVASYRKWLKLQIDAEILTPIGGLSGKPWTAPYIESAYQKGAIRSYTDLRAEDLALVDDKTFIGGKKEFLRQAFGQPIAQQKVETLYTRAFTELEGVTAAMDQQMSRILADGLIQGRGPAYIARELRNNVTKLTNTRAKVIARTEVIRAHAEGQLDAYELLGVQEVGVRAEWSTAGDDLVCPMCGPLEGVVMTIKEARGLLPRHPNCRCMWIPALTDKKEKGQLWGKKRKPAIKKSISAEFPNETAKVAKGRSLWYAKDKKF